MEDYSKLIQELRAIADSFYEIGNEKLYNKIHSIIEGITIDDVIIVESLSKEKKEEIKKYVLYKIYPLITLSVAFEHIGCKDTMEKIENIYNKIRNFITSL